MSAPGGEAIIYAHPANRTESRVVVALDYPALTEEVGTEFQLDANLWAWGGENPQFFLGGPAVFRSFGVPPYEWIRTREQWVPDDPNQPFK